MRLILTETEKKAATWSELDNKSLGKFVKASMFTLKDMAEERNKLLFLTAAIILCCEAASANADKMTQTLEGLTAHGRPLGNWKVTAQRQISKSGL